MLAESVRGMLDTAKEAAGHAARRPRMATLKIKTPADDSAGVLLMMRTDQRFSGYLLTNPSRFGMRTFGSVSAFIMSFSPMILASART